MTKLRMTKYTNRGEERSRKTITLVVTKGWRRVRIFNNRGNALLRERTKFEKTIKSINDFSTGLCTRWVDGLLKLLGKGIEKCYDPCRCCWGNGLTSLTTQFKAF